MLKVLERLTAEERRKLEKGVVEVTGEAKNRTILGIVAGILKLYPNITFAELKEMLPDSLNPKSTNRTTNFFDPYTTRPYGVVQPGSIRAEIAEANRLKKLEGGGEEHYKMVHFTADGETFRTGDGVEVLVANGIEDADLQRLIQHVAQYGVRVVDFAPYRGGGRRGFYKLEVVAPELFAKLQDAQAPAEQRLTSGDKPADAPVVIPAAQEARTKPAQRSALPSVGSPKEEGGRSWVLPLLLILVLLLLLLAFYFFRGKEQPVAATPLPVEQPFKASGLVRDRATGGPLPGVAISLQFGSGERVTGSTNDSGIYVVSVPAAGLSAVGLQASLAFSKEGFLTVEDTIVIPSHGAGNRQLRRDMFLDAFVERAIMLPQIAYDLNQYDLRSEAKDSLDGLYQTLVDNPSITIEIRAHTDIRPASKFRGGNRELSKRRAEACVAYLVERGIDPARLVAVGMGSDEPLIPMDSIKRVSSADAKEQLHAQNRRSDFRVLDTDTTSNE